MQGSIYAVVGPKGAGKTERLLDLLRGKPYAERKLYISEKKICDIAFIKKDADVSLMPYSDGVVDEIERIHRNEKINYFFIDQPVEAEGLLPGLIELAERYPVDIFISYRVEAVEDFERSPFFDHINYEYVM